MKSSEIILYSFCSLKTQEFNGSKLLWATQAKFKEKEVQRYRDSIRALMENHSTTEVHNYFEKIKKFRGQMAMKLKLKSEALILCQAHYLYPEKISRYLAPKMENFQYLLSTLHNFSASRVKSTLSTLRF